MSSLFSSRDCRAASMGGIHLYQHSDHNGGSESLEEDDVDIISVSVFRLRNSYRDTLKYANGLLLLAEAVESHFHAHTPAHGLHPFKPQLRIYYDASVSPERMKRQASTISSSYDVVRAATIWDNTWKRLIAKHFVKLIYFQVDDFFSEELQEHADLFGTIMRFLPLFDGGKALPAWACGPKDGRIVFITDADFQDFNTEHGFLHLCLWFANVAAAQRRKCDVEGLDFREEMQKNPDIPTMAAFTVAGSMSLRHKPVGGLPPIIANCMCTSLRYPLHWFTEWYEDCSSGRAFLLGRYCTQLHAPANINKTYEKRKIADQTSLFPFGCDEQFLANVVKARAMCLPARTTWLYLVMPNVDILVRKCLAFLTDSIRRDATLANDAYVITAAMHTAATAGATDVASQLHACLQDANTAGTMRVALPASLSPLPLDEWIRVWPSYAEKKVGIFQRFDTHFVALDKELTGPFVRSFHAMIRAFVEAVAAGRVCVDDDDYELLLQNLTHFGRMTDETYSVVAYSVGAGAAYQYEASNHLNESLLEHLRSVRGCKVKNTYTGHLATPSPAGTQAWSPPTVMSSSRLGAAYGRFKGLPASGEVVARLHPTVQTVHASGTTSEPPATKETSMWVPTLSRSQNKYYWFNLVTKEARWEQPAGAPPAPIAGVKREREDVS